MDFILGIVHWVLHQMVYQDLLCSTCQECVQLRLIIVKLWLCFQWAPGTILVLQCNGGEKCVLLSPRVTLVPWGQLLHCLHLYKFLSFLPLKHHYNRNPPTLPNVCPSVSLCFTDGQRPLWTMNCATVVTLFREWCSLFFILEGGESPPKNISFSGGLEAWCLRGNNFKQCYY